MEAGLPDLIHMCSTGLKSARAAGCNRFTMRLKLRRFYGAGTRCQFFVGVTAWSAHPHTARRYGFQLARVRECILPARNRLETGAPPLAYTVEIVCGCTQAIGRIWTSWLDAMPGLGLASRTEDRRRRLPHLNIRVIQCVFQDSPNRSARRANIPQGFNRPEPIRTR